jgi:hypothetical protein
MTREPAARSPVSNLESFVVFDGWVPPGVGSEPNVIFAKHPESWDNNYLLNHAGTIHTFGQFSFRYFHECRCDYIATNIHEYGILELSNNVWMVVQRQIAKTSSRNLLLSILRTFKAMYELFAPPPTRDLDPGPVTSSSAQRISQYFDMIVRTFDWTDLAFVNLFESAFQLRPSDQITARLAAYVSDLQRHREIPIAHVAILHSRHFLYYTFPTDVARTLSICVRRKFKLLFPLTLAKQDTRLYWIIGLSSSPFGGETLFTPPILIGGQSHALVALREQKLRFFIALKPQSLISPEMLKLIPKALAPLRKYIAELTVTTTKGAKSGPYVVVKNFPQQKALEVSREKLSDHVIPLAENAIFMAHTFGKDVGRHGTVAVPVSAEFSVYFREDQRQELVVLRRNEGGGVSELIQKAQELERPENISTIEITAA